MVKDNIKLTDHTPFKGRYRGITPGMYEEVKAHSQEMLNVGAIRPLIVLGLVQSCWSGKKDGKLRLCIDLRKLNNKRVKDSWGIPRIQETLDCLGGTGVVHVIIFKTSLIGKSRWMKRSNPWLSVGTIRFLWVCMSDIWSHKCSWYVPVSHKNLFRRSPVKLVYYQSWWYYHICCYLIEICKAFKSSIWKAKNAGLKLKPRKCEMLSKSLVYIRHVVSWQKELKLIKKEKLRPLGTAQIQKQWQKYEASLDLPIIITASLEGMSRK